MKNPNQPEAPRTGEAAHTPTPIYSEAQFTGSERIFLTKLVSKPDYTAKRIVAQFDRESTAEERAEVVRACNSHAALVEALKNTVAVIANLSPRVETLPSEKREIEETVDGARAALQLAKEGR